MNTIVLKILKVIIFFVFLELMFRCGGAIFTIVQAVENEVKRVDYSLNIRKLSSQNTVRVLCVGDSMTGWGGYPQKLEKALNKLQTKIRYVVINKGWPAEGTQEVADSLQHFILQFKPDIVVVMVGAEDQLVKNQGALYSRQIFVTTEVFYDIFLRIKNVCQKLFKLKIITQENQSSAHFLKNNLQEHVTIDEGYQSIQDILARYHIPLVAVQYPLMDVALLKQKFIPRKDTIVVDNQKIFIDAGARENYFTYFYDHLFEEFGHLTPKGEDLLAKNIAEAILRKAP